MDIHVESIFLDVCRGCWLISSLSLHILEENYLCLLVLCNLLEVFYKSNWFSILCQLELRREYALVNIELLHEWLSMRIAVKPNSIDKDSIDCLSVIVF